MQFKVRFILIFLIFSVFLFFNLHKIKIWIDRLKFEIEYGKLSPELEKGKFVYPTKFGYQWVLVTDSAEFKGRDGAELIIWKDSLRLIGGWNPNDKINFPLTISNDIWSSADGKHWVLTKANDFDNSWRQLSNTFHARHVFKTLILNAKLYIIGGDANRHYYHNSIVTTKDLRTFEVLNERPIWNQRTFSNYILFNNNIYVIGGQKLPQFLHNNYDEKIYADVWKSKDGKTWEKVVNQVNFPRRGMILHPIEFRGKVFIVGGGTYQTPKFPIREFYNDVWSSTNLVQWQKDLARAPWLPRQYHSVIVFDNKIFVLGGFSNKYGDLNDVWFSENGKEWKNLPNTPWVKRHALSCVVFKDALYVVSGSNLDRRVWKLTKN